MKKTNIITIILIILVIGLTGYIVYDKTLSTKNDDNDINQTDNSEQNEIYGADIANLKTIKKYAGCIKTKELPKEQEFEYAEGYEYARFIFEIKEQEKCTITYGGMDKNTGGYLTFPFDCDMMDIVLSPYLEINEITYKTANVVMKKVDLTESVDYNFCKNNY